MFKKIVRFVFSIIKISFLLGLAGFILPRLITGLYALTHIHTIENVPPEPIAIVFGAGLWRDGTPTAVLRDRVETAADLLNAGKVQMILMSGDNPFENYNEPAAMRDYALRLGVPDSAIVLDYAGRRTYDTCFRARDVFGIQQAILVTQSFHLPRAIYTCNTLGISASGVASDRRDYRLASHIYWNLRELPATLTALLDVHILHPTPVLGEPEPIFPVSNQ